MLARVRGGVEPPTGPPSTPGGLEVRLLRADRGGVLGVPNGCTDGGAAEPDDVALERDPGNLEGVSIRSLSSGRGGRGGVCRGVVWWEVDGRTSAGGERTRLAGGVREDPLMAGRNCDVDDSLDSG
jgi:hypothetical protein